MVVVRVQQRGAQAQDTDRKRPGQGDGLRLLAGDLAGKESAQQGLDDGQAENHQPQDELDVHVRPQREQRHEPQQQPAIARPAGRQQQVQLDDEQKNAEQPGSRRLDGDQPEDRRQRQHDRGSPIRAQAAKEAVKSRHDPDREGSGVEHQPAQPERPVESVKDYLRQPAIGGPGASRALGGEAVGRGPGTVGEDPLGRLEVPPDVGVLQRVAEEADQCGREKEHAERGVVRPGFAARRRRDSFRGDHGFGLRRFQPLPR